jgi:hypothetical protein
LRVLHRPTRVVSPLKHVFAEDVRERIFHLLGSFRCRIKEVYARLAILVEKKAPEVRDPARHLGEVVVDVAGVDLCEFNWISFNLSGGTGFFSPSGVAPSERDG